VRAASGAPFTDRAALWCFFAVFFTVLFFVDFVYCLVSLIREANQRDRAEESHGAT
jgi:hypothetical protein